MRRGVALDKRTEDGQGRGGGSRDALHGHGVDEPFHGFFRTPHSRSELSADFISSTPSAYEEAHFSEDGNFFIEVDKKTWMRLPSGWWYLLCSEPGQYRVHPRVPMV